MRVDEGYVILEIDPEDERRFLIQVKRDRWQWVTRATRITKQAAYAEAERLAGDISEDIRVVDTARGEQA